MRIGVEIGLAAVTVILVAAAVLTGDADAATDPVTPTTLPSPTESYSLGPAPSTPPVTPSTGQSPEIGEAVQARRRVVAGRCATAVVTETRVGSGPWRITDRSVRRRACIPTAVDGGLEVTPTPSGPARARETLRTPASGPEED